MKSASGRPQSSSSSAAREPATKPNPRSVLRSKSDLQLDPSSLRMQFPVLRHSSGRPANNGPLSKQSGLATGSLKRFDDVTSDDHFSSEGTRSADATRRRAASGETDGPNVNGRQSRVVSQQVLTFDSVAAGLTRGRYMSASQRDGLPARFDFMPCSCCRCNRRRRLLCVRKPCTDLQRLPYSNLVRAEVLDETNSPVILFVEYEIRNLFVDQCGQNGRVTRLSVRPFSITQQTLMHRQNLAPGHWVFKTRKLRRCICSFGGWTVSKIFSFAILCDLAWLQMYNTATSAVPLKAVFGALKPVAHKSFYLINCSFNCYRCVFISECGF